MLRDPVMTELIKSSCFCIYWYEVVSGGDSFSGWTLESNKHRSRVHGCTEEKGVYGMQGALEKKKV